MFHIIVLVTLALAGVAPQTASYTSKTTFDTIEACQTEVAVALPKFEDAFPADEGFKVEATCQKDEEHPA